MFRSRRLAMLACPLACLGLDACSTIVTGTGQQIAITTPGVAAATCVLTGGDGVNATRSDPPAPYRFPRARRDIQATCDAPVSCAGDPDDRIDLLGTGRSSNTPLGYPIDA